MVTLPQSVAALNGLLGAELRAISTYAAHAGKLRAWGYKRLAKLVRRRYEQEQEHRDELIDRILFLGGAPLVTGPTSVDVGDDVPGVLSIDLRLEFDAIDACRAAATALRAAGDHGSAILAEHVLVEEEAHTSDLQALLDQIQAMGLEQFLASRA